MTLIKKGLPEFHPRKPKPGLLGTPELPKFEKQSQEPRAKGQWLEAGSRRSKRLLRRQ
jgi:hypothetical protein